jgi:geranylgeranyl diphosphate synthase type I
MTKALSGNRSVGLPIAARARNVDDVLSDSRAQVEPSLRAAVDSLPEPARHVARYHFGWIDEDGHAVSADGGKGIRGALTLLASEAVGGRRADAVSAAVAVELVHNFSVMHDDIMDGDRTRRHRRTAWDLFGVPAAVLTGDALWAQAQLVLGDTGNGAWHSHAIHLLAGALGRLMRGQCADITFSGLRTVSLAECDAMAADKTAALLACACGLGALAGGGTPLQIECLTAVGEHLGLIYQLVDDLLGIWGDAAVTGKPAGSDLISRKQSLPVVAAMTSGTPAAAELGELYAVNRPFTEADVSHAATLVEAAGGRAWTERQVESRLEQVVQLLNGARLAPATVNEFVLLADFFARRNR